MIANRRRHTLPGRQIMDCFQSLSESKLGSEFGINCDLACSVIALYLEHAAVHPHFSDTSEWDQTPTIAGDPQIANDRHLMPELGIQLHEDGNLPIAQIKSRLI